MDLEVRERSNDRKTRKFFDQQKLEDLMESEHLSEEEANKRIQEQEMKQKEIKTFKKQIK